MNPLRLIVTDIKHVKDIFCISVPFVKSKIQTEKSFVYEAQNLNGENSRLGDSAEQKCESLSIFVRGQVENLHKDRNLMRRNLLMVKIRALETLPNKNANR